MLVEPGPDQVDLWTVRNADPELFPLLLQSQCPGPQAEYDLLLAGSGEALVWAADGRLSGPAASGASDWFDALERWYSGLRRPRFRARAPGPFHGGWALYLGYEAAAAIEPRLVLPAPEPVLPRALALRAPAAIVYHHRDRRSWLLAEPEYADLLPRMRDALRAAVAYAPPAVRAWTVVEQDPGHFRAGVRRVLEYLRAGDVFQVNLSRPWAATGADPPAAVYAALRHHNPAPFAAWLSWQGSDVLSSSPERLLRLRGDRAETRPIAGTRPRQPGLDAARIAELLGDPKERAEHVMLIDLERNDLGRVAVPGSVAVSEFGVVESYPHVHHIVSNVTARLRPEVSPIQAIAAVFPGGTITGCPKVRCMQIIAELEAEGRGAYTGSLGYLDRGGDLDLNILIRTLVQRDRRIQLRAGAGIVADSDPDRELEETRAKARGLLRALGCHAA